MLFRSELAHISLHHVSPGCPVLARHGAGNRLYELEAECFALRVLCPAPVLRECGVDTPEEIAGMCGIPGRRTGAALAYVRGFTADSQTAPLLSGIMRQFSGFIESNKKNRLCEQAAKSKNGGLMLWLTIWRIKRKSGTKY